MSTAVEAPPDLQLQQQQQQQQHEQEQHMPQNADKTTTNATVMEMQAEVDRLRLFIANTPQQWCDFSKQMERICLSNGDTVSCILWNGVFYITGTDIVKCIKFRFEAIGRDIDNAKKFEEGIFSDLRNLKPGVDAALEPARSPFLDYLFRQNCVRTQKKQKVFHWYSVPHDRLFVDALERELRRKVVDDVDDAGKEQSQQQQQQASTLPRKGRKNSLMMMTKPRRHSSSVSVQSYDSGNNSMSSLLLTPDAAGSTHHHHWPADPFAASMQQQYPGATDHSATVAMLAGMMPPPPPAPNSSGGQASPKQRHGRPLVKIAPNTLQQHFLQQEQEQHQQQRRRVSMGARSGSSSSPYASALASRRRGTVPNLTLDSDHSLDSGLGSVMSPGGVGGYYYDNLSSARLHNAKPSPLHAQHGTPMDSTSANSSGSELALPHLQQHHNWAASATQKYPAAAFKSSAMYRQHRGSLASVSSFTSDRELALPPHMHTHGHLPSDTADSGDDTANSYTTPLPPGTDDTDSLAELTRGVWSLSNAALPLTDLPLQSPSRFGGSESRLPYSPLPLESPLFPSSTFPAF